MNFIGTWFLKGIIQVLMSASLLFSCEYGKEFTTPKDVSAPSQMMYDLERVDDLDDTLNEFSLLHAKTSLTQVNGEGMVYDLEDLDRLPAFSPECFDSNMDAIPCSFQKVKNFIKAHAEWPYDAERNMEEGAELVEVILGRRGNVEKIIKISTINPYCTGCRASAIEVIENMPPWVPGLKNGRPVAVRFEIPVTFSLSI